MSFLVARPEPKAQATQAALVAAGLKASIAPVISIELDTSEHLLEVLNKSDPKTIIVSSTYAVDWLTQQVLTIDLEPINIICVGKSTARYLQSLLIKKGIHKNIIVPSEENSEGMLSLPVLQAVNGQSILLLKGEGGRTLLPKSLHERGAKVTELCVYKRSLNKQVDVNKHFKADDIRCIIVTSVEIAQSLFLIYNIKCLQNLHWIVASQRIKDYAIQKGISSICLSQGASHQAIVECATHLVNTGALND